MRGKKGQGASGAEGQEISALSWEVEGSALRKQNLSQPLKGEHSSVAEQRWAREGASRLEAGEGTEEEE